MAGPVTIATAQPCPGHFRRVSAMPAIDVARPLRGWMPQQRGAVLIQIRGQLDLQGVLNLGRLQERPQQRGGREIRHGESVAYEIGVTLPIVLDAVECRCDNGLIPLQIAFPDSMTQSIERWKDPEQRLKLSMGLTAHACRQHAQRNVWIVPQQRRQHSRAQRRPKRLVEIVFQREGALACGDVTRIKRRLGAALFKCCDDAGGIRDGPAVEPQDGQLTLTRRAPDADQVVGAEHASSVRDALVIECPAHLFVIVRERNVPQHRNVHCHIHSKASPPRPSADGTLDPQL